MKNFIISASILSADFSQLGNEVKKAIASGIDYIHFDVMDHHFVPNLSFGPFVCQSLRQAGIKAPIDVHLMVTKPEAYIESFAKAGANLLIFHPETSANTANLVKVIHSYGMNVGLAFNPDKKIEINSNLLKEIDLILIMSVYPGFSGQSFIPETLSQVKQARALIDQYNPSIRLAIDGGIKINNISQAAKAGADFFVLGSGFFDAADYVKRVVELRQALSL